MRTVPRLRIRRGQRTWSRVRIKEILNEIKIQSRRNPIEDE